MVVVGWLGSGTTALHCTHHVLTHRLKVLSLFLFPSLPGPVVGEMPSAARYAAVGVVGRPLPHVVRDVLCEGDEGIRLWQELGVGWLLFQWISGLLVDVCYRVLLLC